MGLFTLGYEATDQDPLIYQSPLVQFMFIMPLCMTDQRESLKQQQKSSANYLK